MRAITGCGPAVDRPPRQKKALSKARRSHLGKRFGSVANLRPRRSELSELLPADSSSDRKGRKRRCRQRPTKCSRRLRDFRQGIHSLRSVVIAKEIGAGVVERGAALQVTGPVRCGTTVVPLVLLFSIAYWSTAESIKRRSLMTRLAWERFRARRKPGTAIAANRAMIATTIMISTRVKPPRHC